MKFVQKIFVLLAALSLSACVAGPQVYGGGGSAGYKNPSYAGPDTSPTGLPNDGGDVQPGPAVDGSPSDNGPTGTPSSNGTPSPEATYGGSPTTTSGGNTKPEPTSTNDSGYHGADTSATGTPGAPAS